MSSLFDIDEATDVVPKKKAVKAEPKKLEVKSVSEQSAVVEPKIVDKIRKTVNKLVETNKIAKRSVIINKAVEKLFDTDAEALREAQYGSVSITIDNMVQDGDVQEITLLDENDNPIESMLFARNLTLDIDFDSPALPGIDDDELEDLTEGETHLPGSPSPFDDIKNDFPGLVDSDPDLDLEDEAENQTATLNDKVELFAVVSQSGENQTVSLLEDAVEAVHAQREATKYEGVTSKLYGLIPVDVHVSLGFTQQNTSEEMEVAGIPDESEDPSDLEVNPQAADSSQGDGSVFDTDEEPK